MGQLDHEQPAFLILAVYGSSFRAIPLTELKEIEFHKGTYTIKTRSGDEYSFDTFSYANPQWVGFATAGQVAARFLEGSEHTGDPFSVGFDHRGY